jgi:carbon monoxide dehydrogenase subunit G
MKVQLDKTYPLPCTADVGWAFLQDVPAVASCMPGATITERVDDARYKGGVTVRIGPATMSFRGELAVSGIDPATRSLRLAGKGTDSTGGSGASMNLAARIEPGEGERCTLAGNCEVSMSGKAAAFGARLINPLADQILKQFVDNVAKRVAALQAQRSALATAADGQAPVVDVAPPAQATQELNGLALAWSLVKEWLRNLLKRKAA